MPTQNKSYRRHTIIKVLALSLLLSVKNNISLLVQSLSFKKVSVTFAVFILDVLCSRVSPFVASLIKSKHHIRSLK